MEHKYTGPFIRAPPRPRRPGYSPSPEPTEAELRAWQARLSIGNPPPTSGIQQWIYQGKYLVQLHLVTPLCSLRDRLWRMSLGRYVWIKRFHAKSLRDAETAALQLVAGNTTVPVPRVWLSLSWSGKHYIFMSRISGATLENVWKDYSPETRNRIVAQLRGYVAQIRTLQTPYGPRICSTVGGPCGDARLLSGSKGPFEDEDAMNTSLRCGLPFHEETSAAVRAAHSMHHPIVFTHGDIAKRNIIVEKETGRILALIDWEHAGWFPAHWEYCKAHFAELDESWVAYIDQFLEPYEAEWVADKELCIFWHPNSMP
ncbi:hypothetical protein EVG20_g6636 [Dentipellis fragilis]|uniref:Aminoglycoside phosphotransferase domain-containing protein n=1 Tax=Dentipellis fragilis TaxID=205917 RepID=A0A4Y9YJB1_9AGAM|nr:hypothetical protein EVG20_g6636 [Dentipellis fragilis]